MAEEMRSREVIANVRYHADRGWGPSSRDDSLRGLTHQKAAFMQALEFIADEASHADINTMKRLAHIALGREQY